FIRAEVLAQRQLVHHLLHLLSFAGLLSCNSLLVGRRFGLFAAFTDSSHVSLVQHKSVVVAIERDGMPTGIHTMFSVLLVPFRNSGCLVHVLDDLSPTDSSVISTEGNLTELRRVRNDAHLCASEVVVEEILEPHACDEQEIPRILSTLLDVIHCPVAG